MEKLVEQNKSIVRKYWDGKWNERHPEILDELLCTDIKYHGEDEMTGIEAYKTSYSTFLLFLDWLTGKFPKNGNSVNWQFKNPIGDINLENDS